MAEASTFLSRKRYAVVTGANKGIGLEICKQLATNGITVVLTARDEEKGTAALEKLKGSGLSEYVVFHQLDVVDPSSVVEIANFIKTRFGKLDILVNNAAIPGLVLDSDIVESFATEGEAKYKWSEVTSLGKQPFNLAEACIQTNYYGAKRMVEALLPFLQLSDSPRIVNVSSGAGKLKYVHNEWAKGVFLGDERLDEERIDEVLNKFLKDFKEGEIESRSWPTHFSAYTLSKAALNAYTKILAKKYPGFIVNSVCPGYVRTDMNYNSGILSAEEGAGNVVRLALLPNSGPSGQFFSQKEVSPL